MNLTYAAFGIVVPNTHLGWSKIFKLPKSHVEVAMEHKNSIVNTKPIDHLDEDKWWGIQLHQ